MIIPNSNNYDEIKEEIDKETIEIYGEANKKVSEDDRLFRVDDDLAEEIEVEYVYRAISQEELDFINENGFIKSNQSNNIGYEKERGLTCYKDTFPRKLFTGRWWIHN